MKYPIPPRNHFGLDHFCYWENFLTEDEINQILASPNWLQMREGRIGGATHDDQLDTTIRKSSVSWYEPTEDNKHIWARFADVVAEVNSRFFHFDLTGFHENAQLGLYKADGNDKYEWHVDGIPTDRSVPRKLSMVLMLSNPSDFEGGELQIKTDSDNPITLEQKRGRAWFFPSYILHRVTPVTKGIRRSLVLWVGGPQFR